MKKRQSPHAQLISVVTGARAEDLPKLEAIMRDEIFHSTLDWQSEAQLRDGAAQAYLLLRNHRAFYETQFTHTTAVFAETQAVRRETNAREALGRAVASGRVARIEKCRLAQRKATAQLTLARRKREIAEQLLDRVLSLAPIG